MEVTPCVMLFTPSNQAMGSYNDGILAINYQAIKFWELNSLDYLNEIWLYPFLPLMNNGENLLLEAEKTIYESNDISNENKADLLTAMAILTGFKDKEIALDLIKRRRDIMMQSPTYEILIEEIEKERKDKWIQQGLEKGLEKGLQEGMQQGLHRSVLETLEIKFGSVPADLVSDIKAINNLDSLWILHRYAVKCESLHEFEEKLK
ncbi:MAG: hypothetical protein QG641_134 [Candidatus Poribacteria bacterium]|nr:hypothetical protein [Candidatus Poribacteria bacterium]